MLIAKMIQYVVFGPLRVSEKQVCFFKKKKTSLHISCKCLSPPHFLFFNVIFSAPKGQVLEFHFLQVHLHLWCIKCADCGGSGHVVLVVLRPCFSTSYGPTL